VAQRSDSARFRRWARLSFHYPGLTPELLAVLPNAVIDAYEMEIPRLVAERQSYDLDVSSFPHMEKSGQRKLQRRLQRLLESDVQPESPKVDDITDIQRRTAASGIGMVFVDAEGNEVDPPESKI